MIARLLLRLPRPCTIRLFVGCMTGGEKTLSIASPSRPPAQLNRKTVFLPIVALFLLTVAFYWRLAVTTEYTWFNHWDLTSFQIPRLQFQAQEIHQGRFPLWNPRIWAGQPLVGQTQGGPLYPPNLLFSLLPLRGGHLRVDCLNWYFIFIHFQAALFCYWLSRDLGFSRMGSILAGCAFSFGGLIGATPGLDLTTSAIWTPLIVLFLFRTLRGCRPLASAGIFGLFLGLDWLPGHHELPVLTSLVTASVSIYAVLRRFRGSARQAVRLAGALALGFTVAGLVASVQFIPTYEFARLSKRWAGTDEPLSWNDRVPYAVHARFALPASGLLGFVLPRPGPEGTPTAFVGVTVLALAAFGLAAGGLESGAGWMAALALFGLLYALGPLTPVHRLLYAAVPMLDKARAPVRALYLCNLGMAVLAAFGLDQLAAGRASHWERRLAWLLATLGGLVLSVAVIRTPAAETSILLCGAVALCLAAALAAHGRGSLPHLGFSVCLLALSLIELTGVSRERIQPLHEPRGVNLAETLFQDGDIVSYLRSQPGPVRIAVTNQELGINFAEWHGIDMLQGAGTGVTQNVQQHELHTERTQRLFAVTHYVGRDLSRPGWEQVFEGQSGLKVFRNPSPLPRVRTVHEAVGIHRAGALLQWIQDARWDPARTGALLGPAPSLEQCSSPDEVSISHREADQISLRARMSCRGLVIVADTFFPGWGATVDGRSAPIHEVYGAVRGVIVDSGEHVVEMRYRPWSVYLGAMLTVLGVLIATGLQFDFLGSTQTQLSRQ